MRNLIIFILLIVVLYYAASSSPWWPRIQNRSFVFIDSVIGQKILSKYVVEEEQASVKIELPEGDLAKNPSIPIQKSNPVVPKSAPAAYKPPSQAAIQENSPVVAVEHAAFNLNQITHVGTGVFSVQNNEVKLTTNNSNPKSSISFSVSTSQNFNYVYFDLDFTTSSAGAGVFTTYVDGMDLGYFDERYYVSGSKKQLMGFSMLSPGVHNITFVLDGNAGSSVSIKSIGPGIF